MINNPNFKPIAQAFLIAILLFTATRSTFAQAPRDKVHIGLVYPISTHGVYAASDTNYFSLNLLAGLSAEEKGLALAGVSNVVKNNANGFTIAGFSNHIGNKANGFTIAGFINTYKAAQGFQIGGFANIASANIKGAQFAGFINKAAEVNGAQFGGFTNLAKNVKGWQFAGFSNTAKTVTGAQVAGFMNTATVVNGSQFAGFINIAKKVKGVQAAGFINIADSSDHPIGIINLIKNGEKSIGLIFDETQTMLLSFRSGGRVLYGIIGGGYNFKNKDEVYAFEAGLGAHININRTFRINTELSHQILESFKKGEYYKSSLRILPAIKLLPNLEIFGGPVANFVNTNTAEGKALQSKYIWKRQDKYDDDFHGFYVGYTGGMHFIF